MKVILMCGSRTWRDTKTIKEVLKDEMPDRIIQGEANGADYISRVAAEMLNIDVEGFSADWTKYGKAAGPIRNQEMLDRLLEFKRRGCKVMVYAFTNDFPKSKGTKDMVERSLKAGVKTTLLAASDGIRHQTAVWEDA